MSPRRYLIHIAQRVKLTPLSTDGFLLDIFRQKDKVEKYFTDDKITLGKSLISSSKDLAVFITEINFQDSKIKTQDIQSLIQLRLSNLTKLGLSKNGAMIAGSLKYLIQGDWPKLTYLDLSENQINDKGFKVLARGNWPLLETLNLGQTEMTVNGVQEIVKAPNWPKLKHLDLYGNLKIGDEGLEVLAQGNWPLLETLDLSHLGLTKKGLLGFVLNTTTNWVNFQGVITEWYGPHLVGHGHFKKKCPLMEDLDLNDGHITQNEIELIIKNRENWPKLKRLNLCWNLGVHDKALEMLAQEDWPEIETINVSQTRVTKKGLLWFVLNCRWPKLKEIVFGRHGKNLAKGLLRKNWGELEEVDLSWDHIGGNEIEMIVRKCDWPVLRSLDLSRNQIPYEGFRMLAEGNWPLLEILNLRSTGIATEGVEIITNQSKWSRLKHLDLSKNEINDEAVAILCKGNWPLLEILELEGTEVTSRALPSFLLHANWPGFKEVTLSRESGLDKNLAERFIQRDLSRIERLELENSGIGGVEFEAILRRNESRCGRLKHLNLSNNSIFGEGSSISVLVATECPLLEEILIENTGIGLEGVKEIAERSNWPLLKSFNVANNEIFDEGVSILALGEWPLLEILNLSNTKLSLKGLETIANQSKWPHMLKRLDVSNNEILDGGLSVLGLGEWPLLEELSLKNTKISQRGVEILVNKIKLSNLKKLDISENSIFDERLKTLTSGKWPLFEHLIYENTQVTTNGHISLLENSQWPNLNHLEHSLHESFFNDNETSPSEIILSIVPMPNQLIAVLNLNWANSNEISLSLGSEKITLLPRDKWDQLESIKLSSHDSKKIKPTQCIIWPSNLKTLDLSHNNLLPSQKLPLLLENLCLQNTDITAKDLQNLVSQSDWLHLKVLDVSRNPIPDEGLEILCSAKWPLLEFLNLSSTKITTKGLENSIRKSKWPNLKTLDISLNSIQDEGLEVLAAVNWKLLEALNIQETRITAQGMEVFLSNRSKWTRLKRVDLSRNSIRDDGLEIFIFSSYSLLEYLNLEETEVTNKGIEILMNKANWPKLKELHISGNIITNEGLKMLSSGKWPLLESLSLRKLCCLTEEGVGNMTLISEWPNLKTLDLSGNEGIFDQGVGSLAFGKWPLLECLKLSQIPVTPNDVETLIEKSSWPNLKEIYLQSRYDYDLDLIQKLVGEGWPQAKLAI